MVRSACWVNNGFDVSAADRIWFSTARVVTAAVFNSAVRAARKQRARGSNAARFHSGAVHFAANVIWRSGARRQARRAESGNNVLYTPQSETRTFDAPLFLGALAFCVLLSNITFFFVARDSLVYRDFKVFYSGARILRTTSRSELYNLDLQVREQTELLHIKPEEAQPLVHPPFELLLFLPLAWFSYSHAFYLWGGISIACGLVSANIIGQELPQLKKHLVADALCNCSLLVSIFIVIFEGQDSAVALLLLVAAWISFRHNSDSRGGFWLGLALFRFQTFIPLAIILAFRKPNLLKGFLVSATLMAFISLIMIHDSGVFEYLFSSRWIYACVFGRGLYESWISSEFSWIGEWNCQHRGPTGDAFALVGKRGQHGGGFDKFDVAGLGGGSDAEEAREFD